MGTDVSGLGAEHEAEVLRRRVAELEAAAKQHEETARELARLKARYEAVFFASQDGIVLTDDEGRYVDANPAAHEMLGYTRDELMARSPFDAIVGDTPADALEAFKAFAGSSQALRVDYPMVRKDGTSIHVEATAVPNIEPGLHLAVRRDITARKRAEEQIAALNEALRQRAGELEQLLRIIPVGVGIAYDAECRHIEANPAMRRLLRLDDGRNASMSAPEEERPPFKVYINGREQAAEDLPMQVAAATGKPVPETECEVRWEDGRSVFAIVHAAPLFDEVGAPRGSVGVFWDVTERKAGEAALRTSENRFRALVENSYEAIALVDARESSAT